MMEKQWWKGTTFNTNIADMKEYLVADNILVFGAMIELWLYLQ